MGRRSVVESKMYGGWCRRVGRVGRCPVYVLAEDVLCVPGSRMERV